MTKKAAKPHNSLNRDNRNGEFHCLLEDWCDKWRFRNGLVDADYLNSPEPLKRDYHCPLNSAAPPKIAGYNLHFCYSPKEDGWNLIFKGERDRISQTLLPFPDEETT